MIDPLNPWLWALVGLALSVGELVTSGFLLLGFGLSALILAVLLAVAGTTIAGLPYAVPGLLVVFALFAIIIWLALAWRFGSRSVGARRGRDINDF